MHLHLVLSVQDWALSVLCGAGQFIICLFVFINGISFPHACLSSIFFYIGVILRQDQHIASFLSAACKTAGCIMAGATAAGVVVTLLFVEFDYHSFVSSYSLLCCILQMWQTPMEEFFFICAILDGQDSITVSKFESGKMVSGTRHSFQPFIVPMSASCAGNLYTRSLPHVDGLCPCACSSSWEILWM